MRGFGRVVNPEFAVFFCEFAMVPIRSRVSPIRAAVISRRARARFGPRLEALPSRGGRHDRHSRPVRRASAQAISAIRRAAYPPPPGASGCCYLVRSSFSWTASRTHSDRSLSPRAASTRARSAGAHRIGFITVFSPVPPSGLRPIGGAVAGQFSCDNSYIRLCRITSIRYKLTYIRYGGNHGSSDITKRR
jgi:hypothetical protein